MGVVYKNRFVLLDTVNIACGKNINYLNVGGRPMIHVISRYLDILAIDWSADNGEILFQIPVEYIEGDFAVMVFYSMQILGKASQTDVTRLSTNGILSLPEYADRNMAIWLWNKLSDNKIKKKLYPHNDPVSEGEEMGRSNGREYLNHEFCLAWLLLYEHINFTFLVSKQYEQLGVLWCVHIHSHRAKTGNSEESPPIHKTHKSDGLINNALILRRLKRISLDDVVRPTIQTSWRADTSLDDRAAIPSTIDTTW
uniref:Uncharacterized protein n=1 Tax=Timema shepardi TaxID=629360 RepID=A0A7R9B1M0_TIMSH|nr:unnamed protein product [Timema shepardi]